MTQSIPMYMPFNPMDFDPSQGAGQLPIGQHVVEVVGGEIKATKENTGGYLELHLKVVHGDNTGSTGAWRLNLYNSSVKAVEIANRQMSALCYAIGMFQVLNDLNQLMGKPFMVEVAQQRENPQYTEIKKVLTKDGQDPKTNSPQNQQQNQQQQQQFAQVGNLSAGFGGQVQSGGGFQQPPAQNGFGNQQQVQQNNGGGFGGQAQGNGFGNQQPAQGGFGGQQAQNTGFGGQVQGGQAAWASR